MEKMRTLDGQMKQSFNTLVHIYRNGEPTINVGFTFATQLPCVKLTSHL